MKFLEKYISRPFSTINRNRADFSLWFMFTIIAGQFGIIANVILTTVGTDKGLAHSIYLDAYNGSFYTFGIAVATSSLGLLYADFIKRHKIKFNKIKVLYSMIIFFFVMFSGIAYAASQLAKNSVENELKNYVVDFPQLLVYIFSIIICTYCYCLMSLDPEKDSELDDIFHESDTKKASESIIKSKVLKNDGKGVEV